LVSFQVNAFNNITAQARKLGVDITFSPILNSASVGTRTAVIQDRVRIESLSLPQLEKEFKTANRIATNTQAGSANRTAIARYADLTQRIKSKINELKIPDIIPKLNIINQNAAIEEFNNMPTAPQIQAEGLTSLQKSVLAVGLGMIIL